MAAAPRPDSVLTNHKHHYPALITVSLRGTQDVVPARCLEGCGSETVEMLNRDVRPHFENVRPTTTGSSTKS